MTKEQEQRMMEELAEFVLKFNAKYDALLDVKVKPRKTTKNNSKRKDDVDEK